MPIILDYMADAETVSSSDRITDGSDSDDDDVLSELDDNEFVIDAIPGHRMATQSEHADLVQAQTEHNLPAPQFPCVLFEVKWMGYQKTTFEPAENFDDSAALQHYLQRLGLSTLAELRSTASTSRSHKAAGSTDWKPAVTKRGIKKTMKIRKRLLSMRLASDHRKLSSSSARIQQHIARA